MAKRYGIVIALALALIIPNIALAASLDGNSGAAYVSSYQISATGPGIVEAINVYNSSASAQFIQIFDSASCPPVNGTTPYDELSLPATTSATWDLNPAWAFTNGACVAQSSTAPTLTLGTAAFFVKVKAQK